MYEDEFDEVDELMVTTAAVATIIVASSLLLARNVRKSQRKMWVRPLFQKRCKYGAYNLLMAELRESDAGRYQGFTRFSAEEFDELLSLVKTDITGSNRFRLPIPADVRLAVTLRYLATGESFMSLSYHFRISHNTISIIVGKVCKALYKHLQPVYMKVPSTNEEWRSVAEDFEEKWQFPMCLGAMDGKHIVLKKPANTGSTFYNYKHTFSIVLLAVVDANYRFLYVDVGCQGRISDGGVFRHSALCHSLESNSLNIPSPQTFTNTNIESPYVFVADDAFPLTNNIMKPFAHRGLNQKERIFNYRLSRARRLSENAFGILVARFRVFRTSLEVTPDKATDLVLASVVLHNFLMGRSRCSAQGHSACPIAVDESGFMSSPSMGRLRRIAPCIQRNSGRNAKAVRSQFADYFVEDGQVPWQWSIK